MLAGALWIVALEPMAADCEIRVNYEAEGKQGQYWSALGLTPSEGAWKVAPPPALRPPRRTPPPQRTARGHPST